MAFQGFVLILKLDNILLQSKQEIILAAHLIIISLQALLFILVDNTYMS